MPHSVDLLAEALDFLAFIPQPASIDGRSSFDEFPIVFYVKDGPLVNLFKTAFQGKNYSIFVV